MPNPEQTQCGLCQTCDAYAGPAGSNGHDLQPASGQPKEGLSHAGGRVHVLATGESATGGRATAIE